MTRFLRIIRRLFRVRIVVNKYHTNETNLQKLRRELHGRLAAELGRKNPVRQ